MTPPSTLPLSYEATVDTTTFDEATKVLAQSVHKHLTLAYGVMPGSGDQRRRVWLLLDKSLKDGSTIARFYLSKMRGDGRVKLNLCSRKVEIEAAF